jgi:hypothetical protein
VVQGTNMAPVDLVGVGVKMVRAEGCQAFEHRVDLDFRSEESVEGLRVIGGVAGDRGVAP